VYYSVYNILSANNYKLKEVIAQNIYLN